MNKIYILAVLIFCMSVNASQLDFLESAIFESNLENVRASLDDIKISNNDYQGLIDLAQEMVEKRRMDLRLRAERKNLKDVISFDNGIRITKDIADGHGLGFGLIAACVTALEKMRISLLRDRNLTYSAYESAMKKLQLGVIVSVGLGLGIEYLVIRWQKNIDKKLQARYEEAVKIKNLIYKAQCV